MKKYLIALLVFSLAIGLFAAQSKPVNLELRLDNGDLPNVTNASQTFCPQYSATAVITARPTEILSTATTSLVGMYICRTGTPPNDWVKLYFQMSFFPTNFNVGETLRMTVTYIATGESAVKDYLITSTAGSTVNLRYSTGQHLVVPPYTPAGFDISGAISTLGTWGVDGVNVACTGMGAFTTLADGLYHFDAVAGGVVTVTPTKAGFAFTPASYEYNPLAADQTNQNFVMTNVNPNFASSPIPNGVALVPIDYPTLSWEYIPEPGYALPVGFKLYWPADAPTYTYVPWTGGLTAVPMPAVLANSTVYTWKVVPTTDGSKGKAGLSSELRGTLKSNRAVSVIKGDAVGAPTWTFTTENPTLPVFYDVTIDTGNIADVTIYTDVDGTGPIPEVLATPGTLPGTIALGEGYSGWINVEKVNYDWVAVPVGSNQIIALAAPATIVFEGTFHVSDPDFQLVAPEDLEMTNTYVLDLTTGLPGNPGYVTPPGMTTTVLSITTDVPTVLTIAVTSFGTWWIGAYYGGQWHSAADFPLAGPGTTTINIPAGSKAPTVVAITDDPVLGPTLPVELSSFTAVLTTEFFVNLTWVTESETQVIGFDVYRSETSTDPNPVRVNATMIAATNTSQQHSYSIIDREVDVNTTYYYWLKNTDMGGSFAMHGPISVTVTGNQPPVFPEISMLNSAYPNPFRAGNNTNISVSIKAGETGTVTVYNILGQNVKSFKVNQGNHNLKWDGKDCGSGIYFYKLSTPTVNSTKKLVIVK